MLQTPLELCLESLALVRRISDLYGKTPETLRDVSVSLETLAEATRATGLPGVMIEGEIRTPLDLFAESLETRQTIISRYSETPRMLDDVSVSLNLLGEALQESDLTHMEIEGELRTPVDLYAESVGLRQRVVAQYGETPESLRALSASLDSAGDAARAVHQSTVEIGGAQRTPLDLHEESLALHRRIVARYGETPERLRNVVLSELRVALSSPADAAPRFAAARALLRTLIERGWNDALDEERLQFVEGQLADD